MQPRMPDIPLVLRQALAALGGAFSWWCTELLGMVPAAWRGRLGLVRPILVATIDGDRIMLTLIQQGQPDGVYNGPADVAAVQQALRPFWPALSAGRIAVALGLDRADILVRQLEIPAATRHRLADALDFELTRHTPFSAGDVHIDWHVTAENGDRIGVAIAVVERSHVAALTQRLRSLGLQPMQAVIHDFALWPARFDLSGQAETRIRWSAVATAALAAAVAALCFTLADIELTRQENLLADLTVRIARERKAAVEVEQWKAELALMDRRQQFLAGKFGEKRVSLAVHRLSRDLPDDIWLQQLTLQNGEIRLYGYAPEPATVINILEAAGLFQNAQFRSPSTRRSGSTTDRFDISAGLKPGDRP
jgi:general secretion pathway protein L